MQTAKQFSVPLVNKPGRLAAVLAALSKQKVASLAFTVMAAGGRGTLRLVPDNPDLAVGALETINVKFDMTDVLHVDIPSHLSGLPKVCQRLAAEHLNIEYAYGSLTSSAGSKSGSLAVIKVNDLAKAQRVLSESISGNGARPKKRPGRRPTYAR